MPRTEAEQSRYVGTRLHDRPLVVSILEVPRKTMGTFTGPLVAGETPEPLFLPTKRPSSTGELGLPGADLDATKWVATSPRCWQLELGVPRTFLDILQREASGQRIPHSMCRRYFRF